MNTRNVAILALVCGIILTTICIILNIKNEYIIYDPSIYQVIICLIVIGAIFILAAGGYLIFGKHNNETVGKEIIVENNAKIHSEKTGKNSSHRYDQIICSSGVFVFIILAIMLLGDMEIVEADQPLLLVCSVISAILMGILGELKKLNNH